MLGPFRPPVLAEKQMAFESHIHSNSPPSQGKLPQLNPQRGLLGPFRAPIVVKTTGSKSAGQLQPLPRLLSPSGVAAGRRPRLQGEGVVADSEMGSRGRKLQQV